MSWFNNIFFFFLLGCWAAGCQSASEQSNNAATDATTANTALTDSTRQDSPAEKTILFFGNSLTAGYGLDPSDAYPALIQKKLDSLGYDYRVINAGLSGETTASGVTRLDWVLDRQLVDIFVLELGGNDGLRGIDLTETRRNLEAIVDSVREASAKTEIILAGMMIPPNMGERYANQFQKIFPEVAQQENIHLIPFLLQGVGGESELNQADGIHPTAEGQKIVANNVWKVLEPLLQKTS